MMRHDILNFVRNLKYEGKEVTEAVMIDWANKKVANLEDGQMNAIQVASTGKQLRIESFKDPQLRNGLFLIHLLDAVKPGCINYNLVTPGSTSMFPELPVLIALCSGRMHFECAVRY